MALEAYGSSGSPQWAVESSVPAFGFSKKALPPEDDKESVDSRAALIPERSEVGSASYYPTSEEEVEPASIPGDITASFTKKARAPTPSELADPPDPPPKESLGSFGGGAGIPNDVRRLEKYYARALECFEQLVVFGVRMDLVDLVVLNEGPGEIDTNRFRLHTEPKSPGTGLRYVRILERLIHKYHEWCDNPDTGRDRPEDRPSVVGKDFVMIFIEDLISTEAGYRTPQAVLYALEFFSIVFGFGPINHEWSRCKKLADNYAGKRPPRTGAEFFLPEFLLYLEKGVLDSSRDLGERSVMGRLRLCSQASVRHNDLLNTPLAEVEWCRTRGTTSVRGLRSKSLKGKTGPRPWVASLMGISPETDSWLRTLMDLMLVTHGDSWRKHKFFGVRVVDGKYFVMEPPTIQQDAALIKKILKDDLEAGKSVPLSPEEIGRFRWHGCKATLTSYMQHYGIKSRTIRHAGDWSKKGEAMPDLYLRESQLLVLKGQEECLLRIRAGESLGMLEGKKIDGQGLPPGYHPPEQAEDPEGGYKPSPAEAAEAMVVPEFQRGDLHEAFRDSVNEEDLVQEVLELDLTKEKETQMDGEVDLDDATESEEDSDQSVEDDPGMLTIFLVNQSGRGKIHKAGRELARPFCGVGSGGFATLMADEALDGGSSLCVRCFGPLGEEDSCQMMCSYVGVNSNGDSTRCGRRCTLSCEKVSGVDARVHRCGMHFQQD